jgi:porphobilinogen synthase
MHLRRLRQNPHILDLTTAVTLNPKKFIQPLFVTEGLREKQAVPGLPHVFQETSQSLLKQVEKDLESGVSKFILFGVPGQKGERDFDVRYTSQRIRELKEAFGKDLWLAIDVCLCSYSSHGHCGVLNGEGDHVDNAASVHELSQVALAYAQAGADCVAPSDMMDSRVHAIRTLLQENDLGRTLLMSYSSKFSSSFYGPFRVAADSTPRSQLLKDRSSYQLSPSNYADALRSSLRDREEGADILMVKPGLPYLDVLYRLSQEMPDMPWAAYEVSGEYAAIEALAEKGLIDPQRAHLEAWTAFFRAGASMLISYGARFAKEWIR